METCGWCEKELKDTDERWPYGDDPSHLQCQKLVIDEYEKIQKAERKAQLRKDLPIFQLVESVHEILIVAEKLAGEDHDAIEQISNLRESAFYTAKRMQQRISY